MEIPEGGVRESARIKNCSQNSEVKNPSRLNAHSRSDKNPSCCFPTAPIHWAGMVLPGEVGPRGHEAKELPFACWLPLSHIQQTPAEYPNSGIQVLGNQ